MDQFHSLLRRQIKRHLGVDRPAEATYNLLAAISEAYSDFDRDRERVERALNLSSRELFQSNSELRAVLQTLPDLLFRIDADGLFVDLRQTGKKTSALPFHQLSEPPYAGVARHDIWQAYWEAMRQVRETQVGTVFVYAEQSESGAERFFEARLLPFIERDIIVMARDITAQKLAERERLKAEETVRWQAYHDALTDLPNMTLFRERLEIALAGAANFGGRLAVFFIDLDRFKNVNDTLGHNVGDKLLQQAAERLRGCLTPGALLARMGGDEFTLLIEGDMSGEEITGLAQRLLDCLEKPFLVSRHELFVAASIGVSLYPEDGDTAQMLLQRADAAMYQSKNSGGSDFSMYAASMDTKSSERLALENSLRHAIERDELRLYYQPQLDIEMRRIIGVEALIRWEHPELGLLPPSKFIPMSEETRMIERLGDWVLQEACRQGGLWNAQGHELNIGVNLFARQFEHPLLPTLVKRNLQESGLSATRLDLELTESAIIANPESAVAVLKSLREIGVCISVDDFGTGYSSLSYLRRLPLDVLKIDRSFVMELTGDANANANALQSVSPGVTIVRAVIDIAHSLGLETIAEGVETESQRQILQQLGCDQIQGFLFSPPVPALQIEAMLQRQSSTVALPRAA